MSPVQYQTHFNFISFNLIFGSISKIITETYSLTSKAFINFLFITLSHFLNKFFSALKILSLIQYTFRTPQKTFYSFRNKN